MDAATDLGVGGGQYFAEDALHEHSERVPLQVRRGLGGEEPVVRLRCKFNRTHL